jgi:hypothetical protein
MAEDENNADLSLKLPEIAFPKVPAEDDGA